MNSPINIFWFRRDLRLEDNAGLFHALNSGLPVLPIFIFDKNILDKLSDKNDRRVTFIHHSLMNIQHALQKIGSSLHVIYDTPEKIISYIEKLNPISNFLLVSQAKS
jgi:deoxyribodipyrimidine photo-lyase